MINSLDALLIFIAAFGGGVMNALAGGGTFLTLPALVFIGVPAKVANATSAVALWPGTIASAIGYLPEIRQQPGRNLLFVISLIGGFVGAFLLLKTEETVFARMIPWLMLLATILFGMGSRITRWLARSEAGGESPRITSFFSVAILLAVAVYGGFFGAGMGILMLAALAMLGMEDVHKMNGLKNGLVTAINGIAVVAFTTADVAPMPSFVPWEADKILLWPHIIVMTVGSIVGGIAGVKLAKALPDAVMRGIILLIAGSLTAWFFNMTYR